VRQISATGTKGFTLIEILVVVAITGIVLAVAAVNLFPSDAQLARRQAGIVALAIEHARDAAWLGGRPTSVTFDAGRLRTWRYGGDAWQPDSAHDRPLEDSVRLTGLHVDGQALELPGRLVFLPDGLGIPFRVSLDVRGLPQAIEGDAAGAVRLVAQ
jgi:general secretion pathway protein H